MDGIIRKISIGSDYKNDAMHYIVGQDVLGGKYQICEIIKTEPSVLIYILKDGEIFMWKSFNSNMPIAIEYNINF
jgi:hypothetical protein